MKQQVEYEFSSFEEKLETAKETGLIFGNLYKFLKGF